MSTITYTATSKTGETMTRTSGTMFYTHANMDRGTWHCSAAAAYKAASTGTSHVVEAVPTKINGPVKAGDYANHPSIGAIADLIAAKNGGDTTVVTEAKETPAQARARQRAAKKAREAEAAATAELAEAVAETRRDTLAAVGITEVTGTLVKGGKGYKIDPATGKKVWRNSGPAHNAYRRARRAALAAEKAAAVG